MKVEWNAEQFERAFQVWLQRVIEKEKKSATKTNPFRITVLCKAAGMEPKKFLNARTPGGDLFIRLDDIIRIANIINMSPVEIMKSVTEEYKKGLQSDAEQSSACSDAKKNTM